jgi:hypothetical protein
MNAMKETLCAVETILFSLSSGVSTNPKESMEEPSMSRSAGEGADVRNDPEPVLIRTASTARIERD